MRIHYSGRPSRLLYALLSTFFIVGISPSLWAQPAAPPAAQAAAAATRSTASVRRLPTIGQAARSQGHTEMTFDWAASAGTPGTFARRGALPSVHQFQMRHSRPVSSRAVRERDPQIGPDDLVIVAVDAQGTEVSWQRVKDPRILRAEFPDAAGRLSGQTLYRTDTELTVTVPDDVAAVSVDVYEAVRSGSSLALRSLARVALR